MPQVQELQALVLRLPEGGRPRGLPGEHYYLPIVREDGRRWSALCPGIHWMYAGEVIRNICAGRAVDVVDGSLSVHGERRMSPERYITRWRNAIAHSMDIRTVGANKGVQPTALFEFDRRAIALARCLWSNEPDGGLARLLDFYADSTTPVSRVRDGETVDPPDALRVAVDLTTDLGSQHAWWLQDYLRPRGENPYPLKVSIEFPAAASVRERTWAPSFLNHMATTLEPQCLTKAA